MRPFFKTWLTICLLLPLAAHATNREQRLPNVNGYTPKSHVSAATSKNKHAVKTPVLSKNNSSLVPPMAAKQSSEVLSRAVNVLGTPYRWGGSSPSKGFDCSGFTRHVFENSLGLILPRRASEQAHAPGLVPVARHDLKPGDLVFFNTLRRTFSHVGIYIGDDKFIHAPRSGAKVRIEDMRLNYWRQRFDGARRATPDTLSQRDATAPTP